MKWIVQLDRELDQNIFAFEPSRIYFRAVDFGDIEYSYAYDTKREALEAFCQGQYAIDQLRKENEQKEAEQKKEEEKEVKVDMSEETRNRLEKLAPMSIIKIGWKAKAETSPYDGEITSVQFSEVIDGYPTKEEALIAFVEEQKGKKYGDNFLPPEGYTNGKERKIMERLEVLESVVEKLRSHKDCAISSLKALDKKVEDLENRLTEIEGVLSSIGSPEWELRKKVEEIEKDLYKISHLFGKDDSTDELKVSKLDVASQKIDLLLTFLEAVCRNLGNDIKKIK